MESSPIEMPEANPVSRRWPQRARVLPAAQSISQWLSVRRVLLLRVQAGVDIEGLDLYPANARGVAAVMTERFLEKSGSILQPLVGLLRTEDVHHPAHVKHYGVLPRLGVTETHPSF